MKNAKNFNLGPRFVLEMVRLFAGSFEGAVLYDNPNYVSPNVIRREHRKGQHAYIEKQLALKASNIKQAKVTEILAEKTVDLVGKVRKGFQNKWAENC